MNITKKEKDIKYKIIFYIFNESENFTAIIHEGFITGRKNFEEMLKKRQAQYDYWKIELVYEEI